MKHNAVTKKLILSKATISDLCTKEMNGVKGGATYTICVTLLRDQCVSLHPDFCAPTQYPGCV